MSFPQPQDKPIVDGFGRFRADPYLAWVRSQAKKIFRPGYGPVIGPDDLFQEGCIGLCWAAGRFQESAGGWYRFAYLRTRGAMIDFLRLFGPVAYNRNLRRPDGTYQITNYRFSSARSISKSEIDRLLTGIRDDRPDPEEALLSAIDRARVLRARDRGYMGLDPKRATVLEQYFFEEKSLEDIASAMGCTPARICQMKGQGLARLRAKWVLLR